MLPCEAQWVLWAAAEPGEPQVWDTEPSTIPAGQTGRRKINSTETGRGWLVPGTKRVAQLAARLLPSHHGYGTGVCNAANGHWGSETWSTLCVHACKEHRWGKPCRMLLCQNKEVEGETWGLVPCLSYSLLRWSQVIPVCTYLVFTCAGAHVCMCPMMAKAEGLYFEAHYWGTVLGALLEGTIVEWFTPNCACLEGAHGSKLGLSWGWIQCIWGWAGDKVPTACV